MNLDECIAALPRTEQGILRDIFSPTLVRPEPYSLDLVAEYSRFSNQQASASNTLPTGAAKQTQQRTSPQPPAQPQRQTPAGGNVDGRYNCAVCKKSFGSEATWNSHEMSAKHIASVKAAEKKNKGGAKNQSGQKGTNGAVGGRQQRTQESVIEQDPPEVAEALLSFRKAERVASQNPDMAAPVLWKIAKALWTFRYSQEAAKVLSLLIRVLESLQAVTTPGGAPGSLSPTQISMTLYLSRLALARLIFYQSPSLASQYYLDAIQGRWQIDPNDFQSMCETVCTGSASQLLEHCKRFLSTHPKTEKLLRPSSTTSSAAAAPPAVKKAADPNLKLLTVLLESASMLSQSSTTNHYSTTVLQPARLAAAGAWAGTTKEDRYLAETSLVLFAMALALTGSSEEDSREATRTQEEEEAGLLRQMALVYNQGLGMSYAAAACFIQAGNIIVSSKTAGNLDSAKEREKRSAWDGLQALVLAMETGDFVRMQSAIRLLDRCGIIASSYQDVQTITELASAVISQDNDYLHNKASHVLEHLMLIIQESAEAEPPSEILLCQYNTPSASMAVLHRVQQLVV